MSQHDFDVANGTGAVVRADINDALVAIASNNSGTSAPSTTFANMWWFDETNNLLQIRNEANTAWIVIAVKNGDVWTAVVASFTVAGAPSASVVGQIGYVSDETGGATLAFADGTNWRRQTDLTIIA